MDSAPGLPAAYTDLNIRIRPRQPQGYPVEISLGGRQFPPGMIAPDLLPWSHGRTLAEDGDRLFQHLLADERLRAAWAELEGQNPWRRIRLRIEDGAPELHALPWELLCEVTPGRAPRFLAVEAETPFSRYLAGPWPIANPIAGRPLRLLVAIANPVDLPHYGLEPLDVAAEQAIIQRATGDVPARDLSVTFMDPPITLARLEAALRKGCDLLHVVAHGGYGEDHAVLFFADDSDHVQWVLDDALEDMLLRQAGRPALVFLASCQSATRSPGDALRGLAPGLIRSGSPAVVAMQDRVPVEVARSFSAVFYTRLLAHGLVDLAANEARSALISTYGGDSWAAPAVYMQRPDIIAPSPLPPAWQQWARRRPLQAALLAIAALGIGVLLAATVLLSLASRLAETRLPGGLLSRLWPAPTATPTPVPPAAQGFFTVALARFPLQDQAGRLTETDDTRWLSNWLFAALQEQERPSTDLGARYLGPDEVQAVTGAGPDERAAAAEQVAARLHAGVLIYGVVTEADGAYHVRPEFYVSHEGFSYGSELTGPERLGAELRFPQPLLKNAADLSAANEDVIARRRALQYTVYGLSHYALRRYEDAWDDFDKASRAWGQGKGLEVIYLLQGAARLELYDVETDPARRREALDQAEQAFARAQALNPAYARSYLGLGAVALQRALQVNPGAGGACQAGPAATAGPLSTSDAGPQQFAARLAEARDWYARSLSAAERPPQAGVDIKADYGLASAGFLACSSGGCQEPACLPGWSTSETQAQFEQVIQAYQRDRSPDAAFLAGTAYCLRSLLDNGANRYRFRAAACQTSAEMLEKLQGGLPYNWIARSWAEVALAEDRQASGESGSTAHRCAAVRAYRRALDNGRKKLPSGQPQAVDDTLLKAWEQRRLQLAEGVTCGDS